MDIASTTSATEEDLGGGRGNGIGRTDSSIELDGREASIVPGTATATVEDGGVDWRVGDLDRHCGLIECNCGSCGSGFDCLLEGLISGWYSVQMMRAE